jgi:Ca-activated chloride channel homolog
MSPLTDRQLAKKLRPDSVAPEPPAGLLDELRRQIPAEVKAPAPADTGNLLPFRRPLPRRVWLAAASVAMLVGGGTLSWLALRHQVGYAEPLAEPREFRMRAESPAEARDGSAGAMQPPDRNALGYAGAPPAAPPASAPAYPGRFAEQAGDDRAARGLRLERQVRGPAQPAEVPSGARGGAPSSPPMALAAPPEGAPARVAPLSQREQAQRQALGYVGPSGRSDQQAVASNGALARRRAPTPAGGDLELKLRDDSGASLPGVTVTVKQANQAPRVVVTDAQGEASLAGLPPGQYRVEAELEGFSTTVYPTVAVNPARRTELEAQLTASVEDVITVTAESPLLDEGRATTAAKRDPWRIVRSTPGVLADSVRVGGTERDAEGRLAAKQAAAPAAAAAAKPATSAAPAEADAAAAAEPAPASTLPPSTGGTREPNDQPYGDVFFKSYGTNPFVDSEDDRLSTFALDVDTGSYNLVRRYLQDGHLPRPDAVRVEELVNAFDYGDAAPTKGDFALTAEAAPDPWAPGDRYLLVRFAVKAREIPKSARKPADLLFVVDVSGSMAAENRLELVKRSLGLLLGELERGDRVGLVVYGDDARTLLPLTDDKAAVGAAIARLHPEGATNVEAGLASAYELVERTGRPGVIRRLILCSDGVANVGNTGPESILATIGAAARKGIELTTVGFGMGNYNDVLMEQLADRGNGRYAYVDDLDEARRIFVESLTGTLQTVAEEARAQVEVDPRYVSRWRLVGYENRDVADEHFRDDKLDAGEVGAGHAVSVLYELKLRPDASDAAANATLAVLRLRWRPAEGKEFREIQQPLRRGAVAKRWEGASRGFRLATVVGRFAEVLRKSYWARQGAHGDDLGELVRRVAVVNEDWPRQERVAELVRLVGRAHELQQSAPKR